MSKRLPLIKQIPGEIAISNHIFYRMALAAVLDRTGLIHGKLQENGHVCAVGALNAELVAQRSGGVCANHEAIAALQLINDSVPDASPEKRRQVVIDWLQGKLQ